MTETAYERAQRGVRYDRIEAILQVIRDRFRGLRFGAPVSAFQSTSSAECAVRAMRDEYGETALSTLMSVNETICEGLKRAATGLVAVLSTEYYPTLHRMLGDEWLESMKRPGQLYLVPPRYDVLGHECVVFEDSALHIDWSEKVAYEFQAPSDLLFFRDQILNFQARFEPVECAHFIAGVGKRKVSEVRDLDRFKDDD